MVATLVSNDYIVYLAMGQIFRAQIDVCTKDVAASTSVEQLDKRCGSRYDYLFVVGIYSIFHETLSGIAGIAGRSQSRGENEKLPFVVLLSRATIWRDGMKEPQK